MEPHAPPSLFAPVHRLLADERRRHATDRDLLRAFVQRKEEDAFAELLRRHGPMVLHLALHLLHHRQDAEDVLQAAFLTLARKARSLRNESSVAAWLHRVAWRLAVRSRAAKRRTEGVSRLVESHQPADAGRSPDLEISLREAQALLHQELAALPERLRQPLVLCYLQGRTRDEAAHRLGWSLGTLKRRLEQGRKLLHARLSRRGLTLSAVLSAGLLTSAEVPPSLAAATLSLATSCVAGSVSLPASMAVLLAEMSWSAKAKALWGLVLLLGACAGASAWVYHGRAEEPTSPPENATPPKRLPVSAKGEEPPRFGQDRFGDPLPAGAIARLGTVRLRHGDYIFHLIRFTPDGKTLISMGHDGVRVWDATTGKPVRHFGAGIVPRSIDLSSDGRRAAVSRFHEGSGGPVEVWDVATGKLLHKLGHQHYSQVLFSPDGKQLAARTNDFSLAPDFPWYIYLWNTESGREIRTLSGPKKHIWDMRFSANGKTLLLGGTGRAISIRKTSDGTEVRRFRDLPADVHSLLLSPSCDRIAFIESWTKKWDSGQTNWGSGTRVFLINSRTGAELRRWSVKSEYSSYGILQNGWWNLAFSPDGRRLAACEKDGPIRIWDTATGEEKQLLPDGRQHSGGVTFSPDGKTLAVGDGGRSIRLIDAQTGADRLPVRGHQGGVTALAAPGEDRTIFTAAEEGTIYHWDARSGRELGRLTGHKDEVDGLALTADGRTLYSAGHDGTLRLWDLKTGKDRRLLEKGSLYGIHLTLSPDGKTLAVPVDSKELRLFNATTGECLHRLTTKTRIIDIAFTADASIIKALTGDRTVWRWELLSGRRLPDESMPPDREQGPIGNPDSEYNGERIVLSPDGRLAAHGVNDQFLRVVELSTQRPVRRSAKLPGTVATMAFAPDGRTLAWAEHSGVVHWLELATWSERRELSGHAGEVSQLVFRTDGKRLISGSGDTTALVWDLIGQGPASLPTEQRDACWLDLADKDAAKAYRAMCRLIAAPADALALLRPHLKPIEGVDERRIERWIVDLDADAFAVREKATEELRKVGELAEPACRKALASRPTLEMRRRVQGLLDDIAQHHWHPTPMILRQLRAVEVLERIGTPEARALLETLAGGAAGPQLTREAKAASQRLSSPRRVKP